MLRMTAHDAYLEATRQEDGFFSTLYDNMQSKILEAAQNKKFQVGMSVYSTLEESIPDTDIPSVRVNVILDPKF